MNICMTIAANRSASGTLTDWEALPRFRTPVCRSIPIIAITNTVAITSGKPRTTAEA